MRVNCAADAPYDGQMKLRAGWLQDEHISDAGRTDDPLKPKRGSQSAKPFNAKVAHLVGGQDSHFPVYGNKREANHSDAVHAVFCASSARAKWYSDKVIRCLCEHFCPGAQVDLTG